MKLLNYIMLSAWVFGACGVQAQPAQDKAFVEAVKHRNMDVVNPLFPVVSKKAYDKALREAARKGDIELFNKIAKCASPRGYQKALRSFVRRGHARVHWHPVIVQPVQVQ